jgi:hypothetical protein
MSERFEYVVSWREFNADKVLVDHAMLRVFDTYGDALDRHRLACRGEWVNEFMVDPAVGELVGVTNARRRTIREGRDLWPDDRGSFSREDFVALRREAFGKLDARLREVG